MHQSINTLKLQVDIDEGIDTFIKCIDILQVRNLGINYKLTKSIHMEKVLIYLKTESSKIITG